jgi:hypothetical protein
MTLIDKKIEVVFDKEQYNINDDICISIYSQGYACTQKLACLDDDCLYPLSYYEKYEDMIIVKPSAIKGINNRDVISVGTVSPASGLHNFFYYPLKKMLNKKTEYLNTKDNDNKKFVYYTTTNINIKY